jgi:WD40 repeat protein
VTRLLQGFPFHEGPITCLDIHSSGISAITGSEDTTARLTNLTTGKVLHAATRCAALLGGPYLASRSARNETLVRVHRSWGR